MSIYIDELSLKAMANSLCSKANLSLALVSVLMLIGIIAIKKTSNNQQYTLVFDEYSGLVLKINA